jgi:hypothetical protein
MSAARAALAAILAGCLALVPSTALAQTVDVDPSATARNRYGPLAYTPALVFSFGHDTNVYREPIGFADYETFVVPQIEAWWKQPGFRASMNAAVEVVHFANNVGANNTQIGFGIERLHATFRPYFNFNRRRTNANPTGFEVGYKSLRLESTYTVGLNSSLSPRSELRFGGGLIKTSWDADAIYQSSSLKEKLNYDHTYFSGGYAYSLTPLTRVGATVDVAQDRFIYSPIRDGDTIRAMSLVEFSRLAAVFGVAQLGYERFTSPTSGVADFNGLIGSVNLGYGSSDGTLFKVYLNRNLQYSYDESLGYYVLNQLSFTVSRRIASRWDTAAFINQYGLDYRPAGTVASSGRVDRVHEYGGAAAYRIGQWIRIGATAENASKTGPDGYNSVRLVGFLTYGSGRFQRLDRPTPFEH